MLLTLVAGPPEAVTPNATGAPARCLVAGVLATVPGLPTPLSDGNAAATQIRHVWITSSPGRHRAKIRADRLRECARFRTPGLITLRETGSRT